VEEEGRNLTAAQRQVIALARAVVTEPDIVILDEATSSLDTEHEEAVLDAVRRLGRTAIFITHRLQVAQRADRVIVVDDGRIVEQGSHDELIGADGPYAALWRVGPEVDEDVVELAPLA
jgi:ATP-binding cassette subfamily B protein